MNMTPPMMNNPTVDVPVPPNSDEALLQGSSDQTIANAEGAVDSKMTHPIMAWENATQQDFLNNSIPTESPQLPEQAAYSTCLLYTSPSPRDRQKSRMPSSA